MSRPPARHGVPTPGSNGIGRNGRMSAPARSDDPPAPAPPPPPSPRRRPLRSLALTLLSLALLGLSGYLYLRYQLTPVSATPDPVEIEVLPGWGAARVAEELERLGLVRDGPVFTLWLRYRGIDRSVGEGVYDLSPHQSADEIADALAAGGRPRTVRVVIPEGFRARDIAARVAEAGLGSADEFLLVVREPRQLRPSYAPAGAPLEGYLFPASYDIPVRTEAEAVAALMVRRFAAEIDGDVTEALLARGLSVHDWVTLASMVQAEAAGPSEMPIIAGVFLNRLDLGMPLQSDPTVAYGLGKDLNELDVAAGDFGSDHPWNTYTRTGLPQGPIDNPGRDALMAVLNPVRRNGDGDSYLYFLHGLDDGEPIFRPNIDLDGHNRDVEQYLRCDGC